MELDLYEAAYLCGGPRRVALTAVVTMRQDRRIKISPARHRIEVTRDEASHPVERAVLDAAPWPGTGLRVVLEKVLDAPDPPPGSSLIPKRRNNREHAQETADDTNIPGYPGIPGRW